MKNGKDLIEQRKYFNSLLLDIIKRELDKNPQFRFMQLLNILGLDKDKFYEESIDTYKRTIKDRILSNSDEFVVITWPEIQFLMNIEGFAENASLINDDKLVDKYGSSAYFVRKQWLDSIS